jgi:DNA-binding PadR family transcriptional regulator
MRNFTKIEELILLAVHHLGEEAYLITIRDRIRAFTGRTYAVGTVYAPLSRLEAYGYLRAVKSRPPDSPHSKSIQYYRLTQQGRAALGELYRQSERMWKGFEVFRSDREVEG